MSLLRHSSATLFLSFVGTQATLAADIIGNVQLAGQTDHSAILAVLTGTSATVPSLTVWGVSISLMVLSFFLVRRQKLGTLMSCCVAILAGASIAFATIFIPTSVATNGDFSFDNVGAGTYEVSFSFTGYQPQLVGPFDITDSNATVDLGSIVLQPNATSPTPTSTPTFTFTPAPPTATPTFTPTPVPPTATPTPTGSIPVGDNNCSNALLSGSGGIRTGTLSVSDQIDFYQFNAVGGPAFTYTVDVDVPAGANFDVYVWDVCESDGSGSALVDSSTRTGLSQNESLDFVSIGSQVFVEIRWVSGSGSYTYVYDYEPTR